MLHIAVINIPVVGTLHVGVKSNCRINWFYISFRDGSGIIAEFYFFSESDPKIAFETLSRRGPP